MKEHRGIERLRECRWCGGADTQTVGLSDDPINLVYLGWCFTCNDQYGYVIRISNIWDRKGRV